MPDPNHVADAQGEKPEPDPESQALLPLCSIQLPPEPIIPQNLSPQRAQAMRIYEYRWVNQTVIHYFVMPSPSNTPEQQEIVNWGFKTWKDIGIGLDFQEVPSLSEAELRVYLDFKMNDSNSYMGTSNLQIHAPQPTMNFGWDLRTPWGRATVLHEIGHAIGLAHEHQNPNSGIVWNEQAVIQNYEQNYRWPEQKIRDNIIKPLPPSDIQGTTWDVTSIMHYPFGPNLIQRPSPYDRDGTPRNYDLSQRDISFVKSLYPVPQSAPLDLSPMTLRPLQLSPGQQADFVIAPDATRKYKIQTVGKADSRLVLFEERKGEPRYLTAADDAGTEANATLEVPLVSGRRYHLRVRLNYAYGPEGFGVMMV